MITLIAVVVLLQARIDKWAADIQAAPVAGEGTEGTRSSALSKLFVEHGISCPFAMTMLQQWTGANSVHSEHSFCLVIV